MSENNILNPIPTTPGNWASVGLVFNPNPSYGFSRKISSNRAMAQPRLGKPLSRDVANGGHVFPLSWVGTDLSTAQRIVRFYHDFKHGYFTFINVDWNGRHFVGNFIEEPEAIHTGNGKYTVQGATFQESPTARMLVYPNDWTNDGHPLNVADDYDLSPMVALMQGTWILQLSPAAAAGAAATDPTAYEAIDSLPFVGDWAQTQYTGWGFRLGFRTGAMLGVVDIALDGVTIVQGLDLSTGALATGGHGSVLAGIATLTAGLAPDGATSTAIVTATNVPLDMHRVMVTASASGPTGNATGASGGIAIIFPQLEYIY